VWRRARPLVCIGRHCTIALRTNDAEAMARRRFHHPPRFDLFNALRTKCYEPRRLGLNVIGFNV